MSQYTVYRRFNFVPRLLEAFELNRGTPRFGSCLYRGHYSFHDVYYDLAGGPLSERGIALRSRNAQWRLMEPVPKSFEKPVYRNYHLKRETLSRRQILKALDETLGTNALKMIDSDGIEGGQRENTLAFNFAIKVVADMEVRRISYLLDGLVGLNLDYIVNTGYFVGMIEHEIDVKEGASIQDVIAVAERKGEVIEELMRKYNWFFGPRGQDAAPIEGKLSVYLAYKAAGWVRPS